MRRIRHLAQTDYIVPMRQKHRQALVLSNQSNILLERTWHKQNAKYFNLEIHAKFNVDSMQGMQIKACLFKNDFMVSSNITEFKIYRVAEASWVETLVFTATATAASPREFVATVSQANLGSNELSGGETYAIECTATRVRGSYKKKIWVNHLGCFDSLTRLRHSMEWLEIEKVDD